MCVYFKQLSYRNIYLEIQMETCRGRSGIPSLVLNSMLIRIHNRNMHQTSEYVCQHFKDATLLENWINLPVEDSCSQKTTWMTDR